MVSNLDIFRYASVLIREHGAGTALEAAQRADAMLEKGDMDGCAVWKRIVAAVEEIERTERRGSGGWRRTPRRSSISGSGGGLGTSRRSGRRIWSRRWATGRSRSAIE